MRVVRRAAPTVLAVLVWASSVTLDADEGFWLFNAVPRTAIRTAYGFDVNDAWLERVRLASVRFGGASGTMNQIEPACSPRNV